MITLLFSSLCVFAFTAQPARAQSGIDTVICINPNGIVTPSNAPISTVDNVTYTFTGNVTYPTYDGIIVERNNTIINRNGYTVQGYGVSETGISLTARALWKIIPICSSKTRPSFHNRRRNAFCNNRSISP
jgi:hypothetical protein